MRSAEITSVGGGRAQFMPNGGAADPLERALLLAAEVGEFGVVAQLAQELEARRFARSGNVVSIGTPRRSTLRRVLEALRSC